MKSYLLAILLFLSLNPPAESANHFSPSAASNGPSLVSANCVDGLHLEMLFDGPLDPASATCTAVYAVQVDGVENPVGSAKLKPDLKTVVLKMDQQVFAGFVTVLVNGLGGSDG